MDRMDFLSVCPFFKLEWESERGKLKGKLKWGSHIILGPLLCPVGIHQMKGKVGSPALAVKMSDLKSSCRAPEICNDVFEGDQETLFSVSRGTDLSMNVLTYIL